MKSLTPLILIAASIALFYLFIDPHYKNAVLLSDEAKEYEVVLDRTETLRPVRDELLTQYNALSQTDLEKLARIVPDSVNTVKLVADIDALAGRYGITIRNIRVTEESVDSSLGVTTPENEKPYGSTIIAMNFASTYVNLISFLRDLEKSNQIVDVRSVKFNSGESTSALYNYDVSLQTYWLK